MFLLRFIAVADAVILTAAVAVAAGTLFDVTADPSCLPWQRQQKSNTRAGADQATAELRSCVKVEVAVLGSRP